MILPRPFTVFLGAVIACIGVGLGVFYIAVGLPRIGRSHDSSGAPQNSFLLKNCVDEKGQVMTDEDGLVQYRCIDRKAEIAQSGDPKAVRELTDTIFEFSGVSGVPEGVLNAFQERLVRAELKYRSRSREGILEEKVFRAANNLALKLNAPDYARAYSSEVKLLRGDSRSGMPHFISPESEPMSPLESAFILDLLIYQKIFNETFLLTPEERATVDRERPASETPIESDLPWKSTIAPRVKEMLTLARRTGKMSINDLIKMGDELLDDLGIDR
jgi:hypothetical protein